MAKITWNKEKSIFDFETEELKGCLQPGGKFQGVRSLIHKKEEKEWIGVHTKDYSPYGIKPGSRLFILDLYHYLAKNLTPGVIGRDMEYKYFHSGTKIKTILKSTSRCRITTEAIWEIKEPNIIDFTVTIKADAKYYGFEVWISSYIASRKKGTPYIYVYENPATAGKAHFIRPKENEFVKGFYLQFPRDNYGASLQYDGRWGNPNYATFVTGPYYAYPLFVSINEDTGYAYIEMAEKETCPRIGSSYSFDIVDPRKVNDYSPLYTVLFGRDIKPGESMTARMRAHLVKIGDDFDIPLRLYEEFRESLK